MRCPVCGEPFSPKGLAIHEGVKHRQSEVMRLRELLRLAHDHHAFGPEHCTPANCSVEAYLAERHIGTHGRVPP